MIAQPRLGALANEFASTFGIFEYALAKCGHYNVIDGSRLELSWHKFVAKNPHIKTALYEKIERDKLAPTIIAEPPKKFGEVSPGKLGWNKPPDVKDMESLYYAVARIRNNLFHGNKAEWNESRDPQLLSEALAVVRAILAETVDEQKAFNDGAMAFHIQMQQGAE